MAKPTISPTHPAFDTIASAITAFSSGQPIIVLDSISRENEGDLIIAAQDLTTSQMSFMIRHTSGLICAPLSSSLAAHLQLPPMIPPSENEDPNRTAYTVSIDANEPSVTTGISAHDRALTCRMLAAGDAQARDFRRPGHVFPLRARDGGVRVRMGHTEAAVEFCRLAGKRLVGVICELVKDGEEEVFDDGNRRPELVGGGMMRRDDCLKFGRKWGLKVVTIEDLRDFVVQQEGELQMAANGAESRYGINGTAEVNGVNGFH